MNTAYEVKCRVEAIQKAEMFARLLIGAEGGLTTREILRERAERDELPLPIIRHLRHREAADHVIAAQAMHDLVKWLKRVRRYGADGIAREFVKFVTDQSFQVKADARARAGIPKTQARRKV